MASGKVYLERIQDKSLNLSNQLRKTINGSLLRRVAAPDNFIIMKNNIITILFVAIVVTAQSQVNMLRYNDNLSYLKSDSISKKGFQKMKYISLAGQTTISFGGEMREQLQYYHNINFGDIHIEVHRREAKRPAMLAIY